jgi:hypothetical protein
MALAFFRWSDAEGLGVLREAQENFCAYMSDASDSRARHSLNLWAFPRITSEGYKRVSESIYEITLLKVKPSRCYTPLP